jgi:hypothetical protein
MEYMRSLHLLKPGLLGTRPLVVITRDPLKAAKSVVAPNILLSACLCSAAPLLGACLLPPRMQLSGRRMLCFAHTLAKTSWFVLVPCLVRLCLLRGKLLRASTCSCMLETRCVVLVRLRHRGREGDCMAMRKVIAAERHNTKSCNTRLHPAACRRAHGVECTAP